MRLDEQVTRHVLDFLHNLPVVFLVLGVLLVIGCCRDQRHDIGTEVTRCPDRTEFRMHEVGATTRVRDLRRYRPAQPVCRSWYRPRRSCWRRWQPPGSNAWKHPSRRHAGTWRNRWWFLQVCRCRCNQPAGSAGFLDVDNPFRLDEGSNDGSHAWFRMVFAINGHATGGNHLERLQSVAVHDHVLRRPVTTGNRHLSSKPLNLEVSTERASKADLDFSHDGRLFQPQVDQDTRPSRPIT
jgi:hypothetical protein